MPKDIQVWRNQCGYVTPVTDAVDLVEGTAVVLQRLLMVLLTETDSPKFTFGRAAERSCPFMSAWRHGELSNEADIFRVFSLCQPHITTAMQSQETKYDSDDQRFKSLKLQRICVYPGQVHLECTMETRTDKIAFTLPMPLDE